MLGSIVNVIVCACVCVCVGLFDIHENLRFNNKGDIYTSFGNYEEHGGGCNLEWALISH